MKEFNKNCLILARKYRELSQLDLVNGCNNNFTQATLSKFENGELLPSEDILINLAKVLDFPISFFSQPLADPTKPVSLHAYRKNAATSAKILNKMQAEMFLKHSHIETLKLFSKAVPQTVNIPQLQIGKNIQSAISAAKELRELWNIPSGPIENLTSLIEAAGIPIFYCNFEKDTIDGVSLKFNDTALPVIFLNSNQPSDRIRFTLAHELGHLILHNYPSGEMESEANEFAAEFLLPEDDIKNDLYLTKISDFIPLKKEWKVSIAALIYRASKLKCISEKQSSSLWMSMSRYGYRKVEPEPLDFEHSKLVSNVLIDFANGSYSEIKTSLPKLFDLNESDFKSMYSYDLLNLEKSLMIS